MNTKNVELLRRGGYKYIIGSRIKKETGDLCICFVALKVYKELERLLKESRCPHSIDNVLKIAQTIVTLKIARPENTDKITRIICITSEERAISYLIEKDDWLNL